MHLEGSCHCRKVKFTVESGRAGSVHAVLLLDLPQDRRGRRLRDQPRRVARSMKVTGKRHLRIYRARLANEGGTGARLSTARRYFCAIAAARCGRGIRRGPSSCTRTPAPSTPRFPLPPESVHCLVGSKAPWVKVEGGADDPRFDEYPTCRWPSGTEARA
jgi:hypothetical protein